MQCTKMKTHTDACYPCKINKTNHFSPTLVTSINTQKLTFSDHRDLFSKLNWRSTPNIVEFTRNLRQLPSSNIVALQLAWTYENDVKTEGRAEGRCTLEYLFVVFSYARNMIFMISSERN